MPLKQDQRQLNLKTPLGANALFLTSFRGQEEMSRLFSFDLEMFSENPNIQAAALVGKPVTFSVRMPDDSQRYFSGCVSQFMAGDEGQGRRDYRARVVPWLWFLTRASDCRIFQKKSVPDIVKEVFTKRGFTDFDASQITGSHPKREYCVQYRETDFNFVSRLLEEEGIFYFFKHADGKHTLVLADHPGVYFPCKEAQVDLPRDHADRLKKDALTSWEHRYEFHTGKWSQTDYNFETPSTGLATNTPTKTAFPDSVKYEFYDYPGGYMNKGDGQPLTKARMEETEVAHDVVHSSSKCRSFAIGGKFKVGMHTSPSEQGKSWMITALHHAASESLAYASGETAAEDYRNSFSAIPDSVVFRPARITPKPVVQGVQTAKVVGPKGEEIYTDKYGRVKVQFHWDREGKKDDNSSCWIRIAHNVAGKQWGFMAIPRIGQEVVVDFLEGDPDCPLITGSVYNAEQMPHYGLPNDMAKSYIKTNSTKGGTGFNELMFDDKKGSEQVFIHAEKNMDFRVKNDMKSRVYGNQHEIVGWEKDGQKGGSLKQLVIMNKELHVQGSQKEHIEGNLELQVGGGEGGNSDVSIEKNHALTIGGDHDLKITGEAKTQTGGGYSLTVGGDHHSKAGMIMALEGGQEIHLKAGMKLVIESGMQICLKGAGGFITIDPSGVTIQGTLVKINSGGSQVAGSGCKPKAPKAAQKAAPTKPDQALDSKTGMKSSSE